MTYCRVMLSPDFVQAATVTATTSMWTGPSSGAYFQTLPDQPTLAWTTEEDSERDEKDEDGLRELRSAA